MPIKKTNSAPQDMLTAAKAARKKAYAPYSRFRVGAAIRTPTGRIFSGCNVENASYGLTCCAERNAVFQMVAAGQRRIRDLLVIGDSAKFLPPCGACRQVLAEFARPQTAVYMCDRRGRCQAVAFSDLHPFRFVLPGKRR